MLLRKNVHQRRKKKNILFLFFETYWTFGVKFKVATSKSEIKISNGKWKSNSPLTFLHWLSSSFASIQTLSLSLNKNKNSFFSLRIFLMESERHQIEWSFKEILCGSESRISLRNKKGLSWEGRKAFWSFLRWWWWRSFDSVSNLVSSYNDVLIKAINHYFIYLFFLRVIKF